jgi:hypothetical protein
VFSIPAPVRPVKHAPKASVLIQASHPQQIAPPNTPETDYASTPEGRAAKQVFVVLPLYTVLVAIILIELSLASGIPASAVRNSFGMRIVGFIGLCLGGFAFRSVQCAATFRSDPFRAVAMGRYVFGVYMISYVVIHVIQMVVLVLPPYDTLLVMRGAYVPYPDEHFVVLHAHAVIDGNAGALDFLGHLVDGAIGVVEALAILLFLQAAYRGLRGSKPHYRLQHFIGDVTFGRIGQRYPLW